MKRTLWTIGALVAAQALMIGIWYAVERGRAPRAEPGGRSTVVARSTTQMNRPSPELDLRRRNATEFQLSETRGSPLVLHFWATWCPPCREELPALLDYAAEGDLPVLAVSLDPNWGAVRRFLGSDPPPPVVLAEASDVEEAFDVRSLPVTFVVDAGGTLRLRLDGPRDWSAPAVRASVSEGVTDPSTGLRSTPHR